MSEADILTKEKRERVTLNLILQGVVSVVNSQNNFSLVDRLKCKQKERRLTNQ